jgi:hypothetical protein
VKKGRRRKHPVPPRALLQPQQTGSKKKLDLKRGQHGRHQISKKKVHVIHKIGPKGEPLDPTIIIDIFSNQCSYIVRENVPITFDD